ncbi:MAG: BirA family transcriptional regulator [Chloroflexi bacterium]|nr:MAG: BirA family transcriptional regulator [Chloroflexota bacterium]
MKDKQLISDITQLTTSCNKLIGRQVLNLNITDSTMDDTKSLAKKGAQEGLVVIADNQGKGRGRFNREWVTTPGQDLTISILFKPSLKKLHMLNMAASLAIQDTISEIIKGPAVIKWPNDVLVEGKKVSGILIETAMSTANNVDFAVLGIGLNVNLDPTRVKVISQSAISISQILRAPIDKYNVLSMLLSRIDQQYQLVLQGEDLCSIWAPKVSTIGNHVKISNGSKIITGRAVAVDSVGNLIVQTKQGDIKVTSGDVTLI